MLPRQVQEANERANRILQEVYGNTDAPAPAPVAPEVTPIEAREPTPAPAPQGPAPTPAPAAPADSWEVKYRVLEGKYNAEVPRFAQQLREQSAVIDTLRREVEELKAAPPAPQAVPVEGMTLAEVEDKFGEDFAKAVGAVATSIAAQNADTLRKELAPKLESVEKAAKENARDTFMRQLSSAVPDYAQIDADPQFTAFLDEVDAMSGRARRHFFNEADQANDAARIARFFLAFKGNSQPPAQPPAAPAGPAPIEYALQPSAGRASEAPPGKRLWSSADIRQFYVDARKGRFTPQEYARIESDIFAAQRENRMAA